MIFASRQEAATAAAGIIARLVRNRPRAVLGLAAGATQEPVYAELVRMHRHDGLSFDQVTTFNLDEYVGLDAADPRSFRHSMTEQLFAHVDIAPERTHVPAASLDEVRRACAAYEDAIRAAGGIDLQLLGIGEDGHIGFNEPSSSLGSRTRLKTLTRGTLAAARARSGDDLPVHAITMGIATIMEARRCVLLAFGDRKARAVASMVEGPLTALVPASALQLHPRTTVLLDDEAAHELALADYYREVQRNKPQFQRDEDGV